jgi:hypothetical protein
MSIGIIDIDTFDKYGSLQSFLDAVRNGLVQWKREHIQKNKVTNYARSYIVQAMTSGDGAVGFYWPSEMELGTGTGTPAASDTALINPVVGTMKQCSNIQQYLTYYAQYIATWQSTDPITGTWTEIGLFDANGNLWAHVVFTNSLVINSGEMLIAQWAIQLLGN